MTFDIKAHSDDALQLADKLGARFEAVAEAFATEIAPPQETGAIERATNSLDGSFLERLAKKEHLNPDHVSWYVGQISA